MSDTAAPFLRAWHSLQNAAGVAYDYLDGTVGDFFRHDAHIYAAAVAFYGSVSFFPFLLLVIGIGGFIMMGLEHGDTMASTEAFRDLIAFVHVAVPYVGEHIDEVLLQLIERRAHFGLAGGLALLLTSSMVFRSLEFSLARVFSWHEQDHRRRRPRNVVVSKLLFGAFAMALVTFFLSGRYLLGALRALAARVDQSLSQLLGITFLGEGSLVRALLWDAVVVLSFVIVLTFFCRSHARPRQLSSMLGGLLFLALWKATGWIFDLYIGRFAALPSTYGPWAALIVIQLWIFYSAIVFMLAAEFVKTMELRRRAGVEAVVLLAQESKNGTKRSGPSPARDDDA